MFCCTSIYEKQFDLNENGFLIPTINNKLGNDNKTSQNETFNKII